MLAVFPQKDPEGIRWLKGLIESGEFRPVLDDDRGRHLVAMLAARPAAPLAANVALGEQFVLGQTGWVKFAHRDEDTPIGRSSQTPRRLIISVP